MKNIKIYILVLLLSAVAVSCFEENEFMIPDEFAWVGFETGSIDVAEESGEGVTATFLVSSAPLSSPMTISYNVSSSNATAGVDYTLPSGSGSFTVPAGSNTVDVVLIESVLNNANVTGDRKVLFEITDGGGLILGGPDGDYESTFTVVILEDDFTIFGYTSFEDVDLTGLSSDYTKAGTVEMVNNPGEAPVDFIATGNELGFDSSFLPDNVGDDGSEPIGVNDGSHVGVSYPFGSQGYSAEDLDGEIEIVFDEVTIPGGTTFLRLDIEAYFNDGHDWEEEDNGIEVIWRTDEGDESVINVRSPGDLDDVVEDMDGNAIQLNTWLHFKGIAGAIKTGRPVLRIENDNNADLIMVDMLIVQGF